MLTKTVGPIWQNRELIWEMAIRELKGLNKGAFLGYFWLVLGPLIQVAAYVVIVSFVFNRRGDASQGVFDYTLYVLSGMIPWQLVTRALQEAPTQILARMELVKQVIYPIETLPLTSLIVSGLGALVSFVLFLALSLFSGKLSWGLLLLPAPLLLLVAFILGISWIFSIVGIFFKDLREMVSVLLGLLVYLSPVVASEALVGERVWRYILWNPLSHIVICFRDVYYGEFHLASWVIFGTMALAVLLFGDWVMTRAKLLINEYI